MTIRIPKGIRLTHKTALNIDKKYHFVDEFDWIEKDYPDIAFALRWEAENYGIDVPEDCVDYENKNE